MLTTEQKQNIIEAYRGVYGKDEDIPASLWPRLESNEEFCADVLRDQLALCCSRYIRGALKTPRYAKRRKLRPRVRQSAQAGHRESLYWLVNRILRPFHPKPGSRFLLVVDSDCLELIDSDGKRSGIDWRRIVGCEQDVKPSVKRVVRALKAVLPAKVGDKQVVAGDVEHYGSNVDAYGILTADGVTVQVLPAPLPSWYPAYFGCSDKQQACSEFQHCSRMSKEEDGPPD